MYVYDTPKQAALIPKIRFVRAPLLHRNFTRLELGLVLPQHDRLKSGYPMNRSRTACKTKTLCSMLPWNSASRKTTGERRPTVQDYLTVAKIPIESNTIYRPNHAVVHGSTTNTDCRA